MADPNIPKIEQITRDLLDGLREISIDNGYNVDACVERRTRQYDREGARDNLVLVHQFAVSEVNPELQGHKEWIQTYAILCFVVESENSCTPIDYRINVIRSDVEKLITTKWKCGGLGDIVTLRAPEVFDDPQSRWSGVAVFLDVRYRTLFNDPYSA